MYFRKVLQNVWTVLAVTLLVAFIGTAQVSAQTTYYVDGNGPGNDAWDGSAMSFAGGNQGPKATITGVTGALSVAADGDTIVILAGNYNPPSNTVITPTINVTFQVRTSGANVNVLVAGFSLATAGKTVTLGVETVASGGTFVTDGVGTDVALTAGTIDVTGGLTIGAGALITRQNGSLTGNAITTTNYSVTYGAPGVAITSNTNAGSEINASLGTGTLTFMHTGALVTVPNTVSAATITSTSAGSVTFSGNASATAVAAGAFNVSGGATVTVSGTLAAAAGGVTISAASNLTAGATSVGGFPFAHSGTGTVSLASLDVNTEELTYSSTGTLTVTGDVTVGGTVGRVVVTNTSTGNMTVGSITSGAPFTDTAANQLDITSVISTTSTGRIIVNGAVTAGSITEGFVAGAGDVEYHALSLTNAANSRISIGAASTIRGDISNSEADGSADGHGIILANSSTLTVTPIGGAITGYGDFVGGTLVINYAAGSTDATVAGGNLTDANNVTFTSAVTTDAAAGLLGTVADPIEGNVRLQEGPHIWNTVFRVAGTLFVEAATQTFSGAGAHSFGGLDVGATAGSAFTNAAGTVTITGTTAKLGDTNFAAAVTASAADATTTATATFTTFTGKSLSVSGGPAAVTVASTINTTGGVSIASGSTLTWTAPGVTSDIGGAATVNGTLTVVGASTIGIGSMTIGASAPGVTTTAATVWNFDGSGFTGGAYTDTGLDDTINFAVPSTGTTIAVKPGTVWGNLGFTGSARTATMTESVNVAGNVTLGNDVNVALGTNSIVMAGVGGVFTLTDEATVTNTSTNGSVQFNAVGQRITVAGAPNTTPALTNVVVNNAAGSPLWIDENINILGTLAMLDGGVLIDATLAVAGPYTGVAGPNATATVTFTGSSAKIVRTIQTEVLTIAAGAAGVVAGSYDLELSGTTGVAGAEYSASQIKNLTVSTTGVSTFPATTASISGNFSVTNATGQATIGAANLTVAGNVVATGDIFIPAAQTLAFAGALTTANNATGGNILSTGTLQFTGANMTHSVGGEIFATSKFSATGITINGSIAAGDANGDSEFAAILSDAGSSTTMNTIQFVNGAVTVNGTLTINMVSDGGVGGGDVEGSIGGATLVNNGGSLTVSSNDAATTFLAATTVNDGGTFVAGSNVGSAFLFTIGNTSQATAAVFDLNGKTVVATAAAPSVTVVASTGATAPTFGTSGTLSIGAAGSILGATNPTIPNLTVNGGAGTPIDSDVTVTGTFTVAAATAMAAGDNVTLSGANAVGQINAPLTSATVGAAGGTLITTGTTVRSTIGGVVTITNFMVNSSSTTTLATNAVGGGANNFTVTYFNHNAGAFDLNGQTFTIVGDASAASNDWVHTAGTYLATGGGAIVIDNAGAVEVDLAAGGASISIPNLTTNDTAAAMGLQLGSGDTVTVTGTLTLSGNIQTENTPAADGTFAVANGATVAVTVNPSAIIPAPPATVGVARLFDNAPTLGTGLTYTYATAPGGMTTSNELAGTISALTTPVGAGGFILADAFALTTTTLTLNNEFSIDENDDGDNSFTIASGGVLNIAAAGAGFSDQGSAGVFGQADDENYVSGGPLTINSAATYTMRPDLWATAKTDVTFNITTGVVTFGANRTGGAVTVGDGIGGAATAVLAMGVNTLTSASLAVNTDGSVTSAAAPATAGVNVSGNITNTGALTSNVTAQGSVTLTGAGAAFNPAVLTLNGSTAQTLTVPGGGAALTTMTLASTGGGVTLAGGNLALGLITVVGGAVTTASVGMTLTSGVFATGAFTLQLPHAGTGQQGYVQTGGCVFGNIRKDFSNTTPTAPSDRLAFPLCSIGGIQRSFAMTFNNPNTIGGLVPAAGSPAVSGAPAITVRHDRGGEGGATNLAGTNGLPQTANGIQIARYPTGPTFFWTVSPNFTMSPSLNYDVEMRGNNYTNFSSSCGATACDINEIFPIRRHVGSNSNLWSVASSTIDNFLSAANSPVVIGRTATGALQTSGTVFTMGLKSIFAAAAGTTTFATTTGNTQVVDLSTLFTGFTGTLTYSGIASSDATAASVGTPAGNSLTVTGGATAGPTTVTVTATDGFNTTATATFTVNNSAALTAAAVTNKTLNVGGTSVVNFADVFSGGAGTVAFTAATSDAAVATVATTATAVTVTAAGTAGSPATITLTATDASSTPITVTQTFTVSVNATVSVANTLSNVTLEQGKTSTVDVSNVFTGGTIATAYAVTVASADATVASVTLSGTTATVTGVAAYSGTPTTDTAPVTLTVTGTDDLGSSSNTTFTVSVTAVKGDLTGSGGPTAFGAALALDEFLGLSNPALTAKQLAAADFDGDSDVDPFDAFLIWQASQPPKRGEVDALAAATLSYGDVTRDGNIISIPVLVEGSLADVGSVSFSTVIDPEMASISAVDTDMNEGWLVKHTLAEDGTLRIAAAGLDQVSRDGIIAVITLEVADASAQFNIGGEGAVNNNPISAIEDVEVVELPETFALDGNYPNPFNPTTTIQFDLPETANVEIQVFDMIGRRVMVLPVQTIQAGAKRSLQLNATALASGSYFYRVIARMETKTLIESGRMTLLK